jgi:transposase
MNLCELDLVMASGERKSVRVEYHRGHYKRRHRVENFFQRIKRPRRIGTRYEKLDITFFAFPRLAAVLDWVKSL